MDVANRPSAFLQTNMVHSNCIMRVSICCVLSYLLVNIDQENFVEKVFLDSGQKVIYDPFKKALYGTLIANLLVWRDLSGALGYWGFDPNPYGS